MRAEMDRAKMNKDAKVEVPTHLILTAVLSSSLTSVVSIIYVVLSMLAIIYKHLCDVGRPANIRGSDYFINVIYRLYIQQNECESSLQDPELTQVQSVFVLALITLTMSLLCLIAAISLTSVVLSEDNVRYINAATSFYVCSCVASLVVDITFGTHFGMDYSTLNNRMSAVAPGHPDNYALDVARLGALLLMTVVLKGYLGHVLSGVLLVLLVVHVVEFQEHLRKHEHSIHKVGVLNAYQKERRNDAENWQVQNDMFLAVPRGPQVNPSYLSDEGSLPRNNTRDRQQPNLAGSEYNSHALDRSESWRAAPMGSRPFSYLEEVKRPIPVKSPTSPAVEPHWRKEWPPVPAPDYSPSTPRRLKSALKPSYL